jgi:outer membrane lipoprotein-sorting protein
MSPNKGIAARRGWAPCVAALCVTMFAAAAVMSMASPAAASPAPASAAAKTPAPPASQAPTVDDIVARYIKTCGGLDRIRAIRTLREKGRVNAGPNREALVTRERKRPDSSRVEFTLQGVTSVYASDGHQGWRMSPFDGDTAPTPLPEEVVSEAAEQADIEGPLVDWKAKGHTIALDGTETVGDHQAYKVRLTLKSGAVRYEYIDTKTFTRLRADSTRQVHGHPVKIETTFSDYRKTDGILFPRQIEIEAEGRPQKLRIDVEKVEVNPPLEDARFAMPPTAPATQ